MGVRHPFLECQEAVIHKLSYIAYHQLLTSYQLNNYILFFALLKLSFILLKAYQARNVPKEYDGCQY